MSENQEEKRLAFPIQGHDNCPHCGSDKRVGQITIEELVKKGEIDENLFPKGPCWSLPLMDRSKPLIISPLSITKPKIPIFNVYWDICANPDCLSVYVTGVDFFAQEIEFPKQPLGLPGQGMPRGFGIG